MKKVDAMRWPSSRLCREIAGKINGLLGFRDSFDYWCRIIVLLPHDRRCLALAVSDGSVFQAAKRLSLSTISLAIPYIRPPMAVLQTSGAFEQRGIAGSTGGRSATLMIESLIAASCPCFCRDGFARRCARCGFLSGTGGVLCKTPDRA